MTDSYVNETEADVLRRELRSLQAQVEALKRPLPFSPAMTRRYLPDEESAARNTIKDALDKAYSKGKYLVAVWSVDEAGQLMMDTRTTWKFPVDMLQPAVNALEHDILNEMMPPHTEPLPEADIPEDAFTPGSPEEPKLAEASTEIVKED